MRKVSASAWKDIRACLTVMGFLCAGCVLGDRPVQMYEGAALPKEQVGIVRNACKTGPGLTIMVVRIDDKDVTDDCADFALLPGDHHFELSAKKLAPTIDTPMIRSGSVLGAPPSPVGPSRKEESSVIWSSSSPLRITCTVRAGQEVGIVGSAGTGSDWDARCQERAR